MRERFSEGISDLKLTRRLYHFDYPFAPEEVVDFFREHYGPMTRAFASLDAKGQESLRSELVRLWTENNYSGDSSTKVEGEYLEVIATRTGRAEDAPQASSRRAQ